PGCARCCRRRVAPAGLGDCARSGTPALSAPARRDPAETPKAGLGRRRMSRRVIALPPHAAAPLAAMHVACFPEQPWDGAPLERILSLSGAFGYLAWDNEDPIGFVLARDLGDEVEILSLGVLPERRRRGFSRLLLKAVIAEAARRKIGSIVLEVALANT